MDRHVIANMGAELGATSSVFPSDHEVRKFLEMHGRGDVFTEITADDNTIYDINEEIDLSSIEPLIALPGSPGNVVPVTEVAGREIYQSYIGSSANPGMRDLAITAIIVDDRLVHERVSLDINPASRQILEHLTSEGYLQKLIHAGARIHQAGCNGCIGMGQAPATGKISLRTVPRNFPGRSGTKDDQVYLCSPETAAASALTGVITDPRTLDITYPVFKEPADVTVHNEMLIPPAPEGEEVDIVKGPNIKPLPELNTLPERLEGPVLLKVGDNISTDDIMPAGTKVLPFRSNIPEISKFTYNAIDETYYERSLQYQESGSFIVGGINYGQGSSREHAALGPRFLGLQAVIAKSFARIHWQNLCNFGILPLTFSSPEDWGNIEQGDILIIEDVRNTIQSGHKLTVLNKTRNESYATEHTMSARQIDMVLKGSLINLVH
jgi:aconitate hydratase